MSKSQNHTDLTHLFFSKCEEYDNTAQCIEKAKGTKMSITEKPVTQQILL